VTGLLAQILACVVLADDDRARVESLDAELATILQRYQLDAEISLVAGERRRRRVEQVEAMRTLCSGLAHELRNPLNSAKLQLELAARRIRRDHDNPRLVAPIELAGAEIDRLTILLDEFLAFAHPHALDPIAQDLYTLVGEVLEQGRSFAAERGAALSLVAVPEPIVAEVDGTKLRRVVDSLVRNAIEAVSAGGHVTVSVVPVDGHVHIRVTDDGAGIPPDVLPRIYEPFFSTKEGGTGMGMSIVHSLVALHHGTIEVHTSPTGTTFDVAVPRRSLPS
jgi:signal transduction histidine kinase